MGWSGGRGGRSGWRRRLVTVSAAAFMSARHSFTLSARHSIIKPTVLAPDPPAAEFGVEAMGVSGSTALVALIHPTKAIFGSLGDCMAVLCRNGAAVKATQQHRVYGIGPDVKEGGCCLMSVMRACVSRVLLHSSSTGPELTPQLKHSYITQQAPSHTPHAHYTPS
jgi:hypothetical protein